MRSHIALAITAAIASNAAAVGGLNVDFQVSTDGNSWSDQIVANPGDAVFGRMLLAYTGPGVWTSLSLSELRFTGTRAGDGITNVAGKLVPLSQTFLFSGAGNPIATLDRSDVPAGDVQVGQSPDGVTDNPTVAFGFKFNLGLDPAARIVGWNDDHDAVTGGTISINGGPDVPLLLTAISLDGARINVLPAPGTALLLAIAAFPSRRRRSRS